MIKFIIEVSEDYIREFADAEKMIDDASREGGKSAIAKLVHMLGYAEVVKKMDEGKTEFVITRDNIDPKMSELFGHTADNAALLAVMMQKGEKPEKSETP